MSRDGQSRLLELGAGSNAKRPAPDCSGSRALTDTGDYSVDGTAADESLLCRGDPLLQLFDRKLDALGFLPRCVADLGLLLGSQLDADPALGISHDTLRNLLRSPGWSNQIIASRSTRSVIFA